MIRVVIVLAKFDISYLLRTIEGQLLGIQPSKQVEANRNCASLTPNHEMLNVLEGATIDRPISLFWRSVRLSRFQLTLRN